MARASGVTGPLEYFRIEIVPNTDEFELRVSESETFAGTKKWSGEFDPRSSEATKVLRQLEYFFTASGANRSLVGILDSHNELIGLESQLRREVEA